MSERMRTETRDVRPMLLVTIDTEGDDLWSRPREVTTHNAAYLPRFHALCQQHHLRPVYLTTYEMALCRQFQAFARNALARNECEIGSHLHPWNSPPEMPLTARDHWYQPCVSHFPEQAVRAKLGLLTRVLEDTFAVRVRSHRGGRWALDATSAHVLAEHGYWVDTSVTPHVNWRRKTDDPVSFDGPDYSGFPVEPYWLDLDAIDRSGTSTLLEVPVTAFTLPLDRLGPDTGGPPPHIVRWLRPTGRNLKALRWVVRRALDEARPCVVLVLHSSELMPGGSPGLPDKTDIEALYRDLELLFSETSAAFRGGTLSDFYRETITADRAAAGGEVLT